MYFDEISLEYYLYLICWILVDYKPSAEQLITNNYLFRNRIGRGFPFQGGGILEYFIGLHIFLQLSAG